MGERAHTPGPWLIELDNFGDYTVYGQHETLAIAAVVNGEMRRMGDLSDQHEANALLIAAAPDMFEALLQARAWLEGWASAEPQLAIIDAVLAKAAPSRSSSVEG